MVIVVLSDELSNRVIVVGSLLDPKPRKGLIQFLKEIQDVFAWCHEDMPGVNPNFFPVKQKRRVMAEERQKAVSKEVGKLLKARSIREVQFPD